MLRDVVIGGVRCHVICNPILAEIPRAAWGSTPYICLDLFQDANFEAYNRRLGDIRPDMRSCTK